MHKYNQVNPEMCVLKNEKKRSLTINEDENKKKINRHIKIKIFYITIRAFGFVVLNDFV
jgi:hypothetical protein